MDEPTMRSDLTELRDIAREFVTERDWDKFHTPKNLATALSVEASELLEPFQWLASGEKTELDDAKLLAIRHEMADVLAYLIRLADKPAHLVRGDSRKYTEYKNVEK